MRRADDGWHRKTNTAATQARVKEYNSAQYKRARAAAKREVDAGRAYCWRPKCRRWIAPGSKWHLGHDDHDRSIIRGPEHAACNLGAASRKGNRIANARRHSSAATGTTWWQPRRWTL